MTSQEHKDTHSLHCLKVSTPVLSPHVPIRSRFTCLLIDTAIKVGGRVTATILEVVGPNAPRTHKMVNFKYTEYIWTCILEHKHLSNCSKRHIPRLQWPQLAPQPWLSASKAKSVLSSHSYYLQCHICDFYIPIHSSLKQHILMWQTSILQMCLDAEWKLIISLSVQS